MRILNNSKDNEEAIKKVILMLTMDEATELLGAIKQLVTQNSLNIHHHVDDQEYNHEITVALYEPKGKISQFSKRIQKLILEDM